MAYDLTCDSCEFVRTADEEGSAYVLAKEHEREHRNHFVMIETIQ